MHASQLCKWTQTRRECASAECSGGDAKRFLDGTQQQMEQDHADAAEGDVGSAESVFDGVYQTARRKPQDGDFTGGVAARVTLRKESCQRRACVLGLSG